MAATEIQRTSPQEIAVGRQRAQIEEPAFVVHDDSFKAILGDSPELVVEYELDWSFAHEAGVFLPEQDAVYITSNQIKASDGYNASILVSRMQRESNGTWTHSRIDTKVHMGNGGVNYRDGILFCDQGNHHDRGGLVLMQPQPPYNAQVLLDSFHGRRFNSPNDVVVHSDGSIWFTDPIYGSEQGICPKPELPNQIYRFEPDTGDIRAMVDGFQRPNGLCFSPDECTLYVTDTGWIHGNGTTDDTRPSTIYAFDVIKRHGGVFVTSRRLFALADVPVPDGIKCDKNGNVYSGCGNGVNVWDQAGRLIGKIMIPGGVANFCFGRPGEMFLLNETRFWRVKVLPNVQGDLLKGLI